ncbi:MAG: hypothetical protein RLP09_32410 [Sandaracinaceae bacterium]
MQTELVHDETQRDGTSLVVDRVQLRPAPVLAQGHGPGAEAWAGDSEDGEVRYVVLRRPAAASMGIEWTVRLYVAGERDLAFGIHWTAVESGAGRDLVSAVGVMCERIRARMDILRQAARSAA